MNKLKNYLLFTFSQTKIYGTVFSILATILGVGGFDSFLSTLTLKVLGIVGFVVLSYSIALIWTLKTNKISIDIGDNREVSIEFGDLFDGQSLVIPFNRYFDTLVNEDVISQKSIVGQFIGRYFSGNVNELDTFLENGLSLVSSEQTDKKYGKNKAYPIGTVIVYKYGEKSFYLIASTEAASMVYSQPSSCARPFGKARFPASLLRPFVAAPSMRHSERFAIPVRDWRIPSGVPRFA